MPPACEANHSKKSSKLASICRGQLKFALMLDRQQQAMKQGAAAQLMQ
jgi:hypothetical protein